MPDRRLPFTVKDDQEVPREGEIVIVRDWNPDIELNPAAAFTIVLAQRPLAADSPPPGTANVAVCAPASSIRLPATVAEAAVTHETGGTPAVSPLRLSRQAMAAYADGTLLSKHPLSISTRDVFSDGLRQPQLELLGRDLLAAVRRVEAWWRTLDEILSWPRAPARVVRPDQLRARLSATLERIPAPPGNTLADTSIAERIPAPPSSALADTSIVRLREIAAGAQPNAIASSPAELKEDVALARCLAERPEEVAELAAMRAYLDAATPGPQMHELFVDHAVTRERLSFAALLDQPRELESMRATFELFQSGYVEAYTEHHRRHWRAFARLRAILDEGALTAQALVRLNTLRALGRPVGRAALAAYGRMTRGRRACSARELASALREQPLCPDCGITMENGAPSEETEEVLRRLHAALARQQARLAGEAVRRILARGGERIDQFLQIVQASDPAGLAQVLDDQLLAFLQELLSQPVSPTPEALDLFQELARAYPVVSEEQVEAVIGTLRQLLTEKLAVQRAADPAQPTTFRLASAPPPAEP